jgi:outer membrane protein assembly factor BamB
MLARGVPLAAAVRERIARVLDLPGGREAFAPLEERAASLLAEARASTAAEPLAAVGELYPHSRAAEEALALRLERAVDARDAAAVAALVRAALERGALSPEREDALLLRLARVLGERGNVELERSLMAELARVAPQLRSELPEHDGRTLAELAAALGDAAPESPAAPVLFPPTVLSSGNQLGGTHVFLGALQPAGQAAEGAPSELHLYATRDELLAFSSAAPGAPAWRRPLDEALDTGDAPCAFAPGRFVFGTRDALICLDERGEERWTHALGGDAPRTLATRGGVLVALTRGNSVVALDVWLGLPLWQRSFGASGAWSGPVLGPAHAVFFSHVSALPPRALALDLYRGRVTKDMRLANFDSRSALAETAWVAGRNLIAPSFHLRPSVLAAFSLDDGQRAWTIEFGRDEELSGLVRSEGKTFAVTLASSLDRTAGNGGVYLVDETSGTRRLIVPLKPGERVMGLDAQGAIDLPAPYLFTYTYSESERGVPIRAIHLPFGFKWAWSLPIASQEMYDGRNLPMPAVSADCVAIAYPRRTSGGGGETWVVFVDRQAGKKIDTQRLGEKFDQSNRIELRGLGTALFVLGKSPPSRGTCLEILESPR